MSTSQTQNDLDALLNLSEKVGTLPPETNVLKRAKDIIYRPALAWPIIAEEKGGLKEIFIPYTVMIGLVPMLIGSMLGATVFGAVIALMGGTDLGIASALFFSVLHYIYWVVGILLLGKVLELMAPTLQLRPSWVLSCRVLVYASTPVWVMSLISWLPLVGWLLMLMAFIRSLLLAYRGAMVVLKVEKKETEPVAELVKI